MDELISVIVPVYNIEQHLPRCLHAISEQTYRNLEIILVDDGSTDRSGILCDEFAARDSRARVIHQHNTGLWAARNTGMDAARGAYLFLPDGDDYFHQDILLILHEAINRGKGYDLAICHKKKTKTQDEDTSYPVSVNYVEVTQNDLYLCLFYKDDACRWYYYSHNVWNKLYRRCLVESLRFNPYPVAQDRDFLIRLYLFVKKAILVDNFLYYWVRHPDSIMHSSSYPSRRSMCHVMMDYSNYLLFSGEDQHRYRDLLLEDLYKHILIWRELLWFSSTRKDVCSKCNEIINHTRESYLQCQSISFLKRTATFLLARFSLITHFLIGQIIKKNNASI